ncbi:MAG: UbiA family prenyltransferase [Desulfarculus sp.]|nr:UbiA family prenyltransferase [Desulfarculus sp.]
MIADLARLTRARLGLLAAAGAMAGHLLWRPRPSLGLLLTAAGAWLLAAGYSALNQAQERQRDGVMGRTRDRPLPAGRLGLGPALALALVCLILALALLRAVGGWGPPLLGLAVVSLYNGLYTPLKGRTPLALLLGAGAGAMPPLLGWLAAGGPLLDPRALLVAGVFYCWQVPHFALLARLRADDYQAAGLPLAGLARTGGWGRWPLLVWLMAYGTALALVPALGLVTTPAAKLCLAVLALGLGLGGVWIVRREQLGLRLVNASLALFLACLMADALWRGI